MSKTTSRFILLLSVFIFIALVLFASPMGTNAAIWQSSNNFSTGTVILGTGSSGLLSIEFDVTPLYNNIDGVIGYADGTTNITGYSSLGMIVRMNTGGTFDVRDGAVYQAVKTVAYTANSTYHVKIVTNIASKKFDVWVNRIGQPQVQIASAYSYRSDAPAINSIGKVCLYSTTNQAFSVNNHKIANLDVYPGQASVLNAMRTVNDYWINGHLDGGDRLWANGVYHTGNTACFDATQDLKYYNHSTAWSQKLAWKINNGTLTGYADDQVAGTTFIKLYQLQPADYKIANIKANIDAMVNNSKIDDWWWIDAFYMAMPIFTKLGVIYNNNSYFNKMYALYNDNKVRRGLYDNISHLWYRDEGQKYPQKKTPAGNKVFWSRGNGWVFGAMVKILDELPASDPHYNEYLTVFKDMAAALKDRQRSDGFWNVSLDDPNDYGGSETSGTAAFTYGMAWGIRKGHLNSATYKPVVAKAWNGLVNSAVQPSGKLGYVQGVGYAPLSSQPVTSESTSDFGVGLFLLAGSEVVKLCNDYSAPPKAVLPGSNQVIALKAAANGKYVAAENQGASSLRADRASAGTWEQFEIVDLGNNRIALKSLINGRYVCADNYGNDPLIANKTAIGTWETFEVITLPDGKKVLKALANNKYVCADLNRAVAGELIADRASYSTWETFEFISQ